MYSRPAASVGGDSICSPMLRFQTTLPVAASRAEMLRSSDPK
jgi:hypothetical protein